eukprot:767723-Hanusia_phi.AAC.2
MLDSHGQAVVGGVRDPADEADLAGDGEAVEEGGVEGDGLSGVVEGLRAVGPHVRTPAPRQVPHLRPDAHPRPEAGQDAVGAVEVEVAGALLEDGGAGETRGGLEQRLLHERGVELVRPPILGDGGR